MSSSICLSASCFQAAALQRHKEMQQVSCQLASRMNLPFVGINYSTKSAIFIRLSSKAATIFMHPLFLMRQEDLQQKKIFQDIGQELRGVNKFSVQRKKDICKKFIRFFNGLNLYPELLGETDQKTQEVALDVLYMLFDPDGGKAIRQGAIAHELAHYYIDHKLCKDDPLGVKPFLREKGIKLPSTFKEWFYRIWGVFFGFIPVLASRYENEKAADWISLSVLKQGEPLGNFYRYKSHLFPASSLASTHPSYEERADAHLMFSPSYRPNSPLFFNS